MSELQSGLILAGVVAVVLVYGYNWWQSARRRREIERAVAAHSGRGSADAAPDPLDDGFDADAAPAQRAASRTEPQVGAAPPRRAPAPPPTTVAERYPVDDEGVDFHIGDDEPPVPAAAPVRNEPRALVEPREPAPPPERVLPAVTRSRPGRGPGGGLALRGDPPDTDSRVDFVIRLLPMEPLPAEQLSELLTQAPEFGHRLAVLGCPVGGQDWQPVMRQAARYEELALCLQQVDRGGLIERSSLDRFTNWVESVAEAVSAGFNPPDAGEAHAIAAAFDAFCAEADVLIGVNVVAPDVPVPATKVRALVEAAGFRLQPAGHYALEDDDGNLLITLADIDGEPFVAERIRTAAMRGVTLLLDIPRTRKPARVFNQMIQIARQVAQGIGGRVVDDQRQPLSDAGVRVIAGRVEALETRLAAQQMAPGSVLARRVFA